MVSIILAVIVSLVISLIGTPLFIRFLISRNLGQFIRQDGPTSHFVKRGTPTLGGVIIIAATVFSWFVVSVVNFITLGRLPRVSSILLIFLVVGMGLIGFFDDYKKITKKQSLGLKPWQKIIAQLLVGSVFTILALNFPNQAGITPASTNVLIMEKVSVNLEVFGKATALFLFLIWINFLIVAWSNAVNLTDGLDGLATGCSIFAFGGYILITLWTSNKSCQFANDTQAMCYNVRDSWDLAIVGAAIAGATFGFLWWNTSPAKIFMGDTGSLALGGAFAGMSILTNTEFLAIIIGGVFVLEALSDIIQVVNFKITKRRAFKMAPLHHHFELMGWGEVTTVVRFWMLSAMFVVIGVSLFYAQWLVGFKF